MEDFYEVGQSNGSWIEIYEECNNEHPLQHRKEHSIDIMKRIMFSEFETGTAFMFYGDKVNRMNNNAHEGMIYCSNLCTEITQNMSPTEFLGEVSEADGTITKKYKTGDYVVCNLSSIHL